MSCAKASADESASIMQRARTPTPPEDRARQRRRRHDDADEAEALVEMVLGSIAPFSDWYKWCMDGGLYMERTELMAALADHTVAVVVVDVRDDDVVGGMITTAMHCPDSEFSATTVLEILREAKRARDLARHYLRPTGGGVVDTHDSTETTAPALELSVTTVSSTLANASTDPITADAAIRSLTKTWEDSSRTPVTVVFHCMESARRGPRCARRFLLALEALDECEHPRVDVTVRVLAGGFDQWVRRLWADPAMVTGYSEDYWNCAEFGIVSDDDNDDNGDDDHDDGGSGFRSGAQGESGVVDGPALSNPAHPLYHRPVDQPATPWSAAGSTTESGACETRATHASPPTL